MTTCTNRSRRQSRLAARSMNRVPLVTTRLAEIEPLLDLDQPVAGVADDDGTRRHGLGIGVRHPDAGVGAFVDDRIDRHRGHRPVFARDDAEGGEHLGLELEIGIPDRGAHRQAARVGIEGRCHIVELGVEDLAGEGEHDDVDRRADLHLGRVELAHVGDQPDRRQVADRVDRVVGTGVDVLAEPDLTLDDGAGDRRRHDGLRADAIALLEVGDLLVAAAKDAQAVAHRRQRDLGGAQIALRLHQIRLRLLEVF